MDANHSQINDSLLPPLIEQQVLQITKSDLKLRVKPIEHSDELHQDNNEISWMLRTTSANVLAVDVRSVKGMPSRRNSHRTKKMTSNGTSSKHMSLEFKRHALPRVNISPCTTRFWHPELQPPKHRCMGVNCGFIGHCPWPKPKMAHL